MTNFVNALAKDIMFAVRSENICHAKLNDKQQYDVILQQRIKNYHQMILKHI